MSSVNSSYRDLALRLSMQAGGCTLSPDSSGVRLSPIIANTVMPIVVGRDGTIRLGRRDCSETQIIRLLAGLKRIERRTLNAEALS
ncbi:hypothetical protein [Gluconobacter sp. Dm-44]|uniref:hypothetical protein n=1 Tax=Gluconobacter sp. Dm-44 TaxID=2799805 RepID=UPI001B8BA80F|nr:hypothetical protein [Gluconobacter sp. Dm-44]MBS1061177.1 hypothetical protein [Gluconobacter sp. Dm-44]